MLDLVATGPESGQRWRRQVPKGVAVRLGRTPQDGWDVPWDMRVSREHANLRLDGDQLRIQCLKTATNPVYYRGEPFREVVVDAESDFRIGETTFRLEKVPEEIAALVAPGGKSPPKPASNETVIVSDLDPSDIENLEASLARYEAEAHKASQLAEQRSAEIQELQKEIQALHAKKTDDSDSRKQAKADAEEARKSAKEQAKEIERLRKRNEQLQHKLDSKETKAELASQKELVELHSQNEKLQAAVDRLTQEREALEKRLDEAVKFATKTTETNKKQVGQLRREIEQLQGNVADVTAQRDSLKEKVAELETRPADDSHDRLAAEKKLAQAKDELEKANARAGSLEARISDLESERQAAGKSLREAMARVQREQRAVEGLNSEREHLKAEVDSLKSRIISGEKSLSTARKTAEQHAREAKEREAEADALRAAVASLRKHLEEKNNELHDAQAATRQKTDDTGKLNAINESLKIDIEALNEQIENRDVSLEIIRLENKEKAEETRQLRRLNQGLQDEVESLRSQIQSHNATLRKSGVQAQHEAREAMRFREQNEALIEEIRVLKRKLEGSRLSQIESLSASRQRSQSSPQSTAAPEQDQDPEGGTDDTVDEKMERPRYPGEMKQFGQYRILEKIGQGGMGVVFKAVHTRLDKVVALKIVTEGRLHTPEHIARFDREMKAIGRLDHGNLVRAHDAGETDDALYLVMEYVDGMDVTDLVRFAGRIPLPDACEIVRQAAMGMEYVHRRKLVHRDLKPSNLMLTRGGQVKILDLGLAQLNDWGGEGLTQSGQIMGTLEYMAPEQAGDSRLVDYRADIYSLGCTFFEMLAGNSPYSDRGNESLAELILAHATRALPPLASVRPDVPRELEALLNHMTAKVPNDRPASMESIAFQLEPFCRNSSLSALLTTATASLRQGQSMSSWDREKFDSKDKDDTSHTCSATMATWTDSSDFVGPQPFERESADEVEDEPVADDKG